ncbi:hypothetical protein CANINC_000156 [Pichia inconspicua]|uniref:Vacuolar protein sorting-associated protein 20 n=1 Tax=Pichia inconspicua TaxID=52247 RepID=A0A4T0X756_9ASCO|nr:hypothetical protein CANINC_000156 [[Candida] inconspicua]
MGNTTSTNPKITHHDKAVLQLKLQRDKLTKSKQKIQVVLNREDQIIRQLVKENNLEKAKLALRKKKRQQSLLSTLERQSSTLEELIDTIEFKLIEKDVFYGIQEGAKVLKEINNEMSLEKVEKIMDESAEAVSYQNELSERLSGLLTNQEESEVDEELRQLEIEMGIVKPIELPNAPVKKLPEIDTVSVEIPEEGTTTEVPIAI